jgi:hypothetical protein
VSACDGFQAVSGYPGVSSNLADPTVDEREEALDAAVGQFGQRDFRPLAAQYILTIKTRYAQGVQVGGQALASLLTVVWGPIARLIDTDLKGWPTAVRVSVKATGLRGVGRPVARPVSASTINDG